MDVLTEVLPAWYFPIVLKSEAISDIQDVDLQSPHASTCWKSREWIEPVTAISMTHIDRTYIYIGFLQKTLENWLVFHDIYDIFQAAEQLDGQEQVLVTGGHNS